MISETVARQSLKVLQASSLQTPQLVGRDLGHSNRPIAAPTQTGSAKVEAAITAIINIILDAQGNSVINIFAKDATASVQTGDSHDIINMYVHKVRNVSSGNGDDRIFIKTNALNNEDQEQHYKGLFAPAIVTNVSTGDGNDTLVIDSHGNVDSIYTGDGDDTIAIKSRGGVRIVDGDDIINMDVHKVRNVSSGKGDDRIFIKTYALNSEDQHYKGRFVPAVVGSVSTGDGEDTLDIDSHGNVASIRTGDGVDTIDIKSGGDIWSVDAGNGDDDIAISANSGFADVIRGDAGDDTLDIAARYVTRIFGCDGDDAMRIEAVRAVNSIHGGGGNDIIEVTAPTIAHVIGGKGDDTMVLTNTANSYSHISFQIGDGHDVVEVNSAVAVERFLGRNHLFDMSEATIERIDDATLKITFDDSDDSVTINFTGNMVGKPLAFDFYKGGHVMIRRNDSDAPALPQFGHALNPVVLTRYA